MLKKMTSLEVIRDSVLRVGQVVSVEGRTVEVEVDKLKNSSNLVFAGSVIKNTSVGGYVKIGKGFTWIIAKVEGEKILEDKDFSKRYYKSPTDRLKRVLQLSLLGFIDDKGRFRRGIKELPLVYNECYLLTSDEFKQIHSFVKSDDESIIVGHLSYEKNQQIEVGVDALFASHFGIFGNTGSGKSYTLSKIYYELFKKYDSSDNFIKNSTFLLIDFNGEYISNKGNQGEKGTNVLTSNELIKQEYELSTKTSIDKFPLEEATINNHELWSLILEATEKTQAPFLRRAIEYARWKPYIDDDDAFKAQLGDFISTALKDSDSNQDKNFASNLLKEIHYCFPKGSDVDAITLSEDYDEHLKWHSVNRNFYYENGTPIYSSSAQWNTVTVDKVMALNIPVSSLSPLAKIHILIVLQYFDESARGFSNKEHLAPLIKRLSRRITDMDRVFLLESPGDDSSGLQKPLQIVSLKNVNLTMRKIIPMVLSKVFYDKKKLNPDKDAYLNLIIDEAHNILSFDSTRESEQWRDYRLETFEEIIKEGRKFGTFLTIASQRPSDISPTILSQLHNYFLHRLINDRDIKAVEKTVSYLDRLSFESMPILPTGTCILAGILAQIPVVVDIEPIPIENAPNNETMSVSLSWKKGK